MEFRLWKYKYTVIGMKGISVTAKNNNRNSALHEHSASGLHVSAGYVISSDTLIAKLEA